MPMLTKPIKIWAGAMRSAVGAAWRNHVDPSKRVECVLKELPHFLHKLEKARRMSFRCNCPMEFGVDFGQFDNKDAVLLYLIDCAGGDREFFLRMLRDLEQAIDRQLAYLKHVCTLAILLRKSPH